MLQFKNVTIYRNGKSICKDLFLNIGKGTCCIISGKNSSGKSSVLSCLIGELKPTSGQILLDQYDLHRLSSRERKMFLRSTGIVLQHEFLRPFDSVASFFSQIEATPKDIQDLLHFFQLSLDHETLLHELSASEKKKLEIIASFLKRPKLLIWDEPFHHLDKESQEKIKSRLLRERSMGTTIVLASSDADSFQFLNPENVVRL